MSSIDGTSRPTPVEAGADRRLSDADRATLLRVARASIAHGLRHGRALTVDLAAFPESLRVPRATFVTLHLGGELRGCIGMLEALRPLLEDVASNAFAAAFSDPRFPPVRADELDDLAIEISVLSPPEPVAFDSEPDLVRRLRPGVDGLILEDGLYRGTFLPAVWDSLPGPGEFLSHLKRKAGLSPDYWSPTLKVSRYTTESFS